MPVPLPSSRRRFPATAGRRRRSTGALARSNESRACSIARSAVFLRDWWQAMIAECPFEATRDDRKSAALAAERLTVSPDARIVSGLAFARELLRSNVTLQAATMAI